MKKLIEHLTDDLSVAGTRELYVNENQVETVTPLRDGSGELADVAQVRMHGGTVYQVRGTAASVAAELKSASEATVETVRDSLIPALAAFAPTFVPLDQRPFAPSSEPGVVKTL